MIHYIPPHPSMGQRSQYQFQGATRAPLITQVGQRDQVMGRGRGRGPQAGTSGVQRCVYATTPPVESANQPDVFSISPMGKSVI